MNQDRSPDQERAPMNRPEGEQAPPDPDFSQPHAGQRVAQGGAERTASPGGRTIQSDPRSDGGIARGDPSSDEPADNGEA